MTYPVTDTSSQHRICNHCLDRKPVEDFRRRYRNQPLRLSQCRDCHNRVERERRAAHRQKMTRKELAKALTKVKKQRSDLQVKALCREMVERFGGLKGIAEAWGRSLDQDLSRGGYAAFRHLEAILRLTQYCEQNRPDYGSMTDEELERAIGELGGQLEAL
jgi:uncharacterized protein YlaI